MKHNIKRQTRRIILFCCRRRCRKIYSGTIQFLPPGSFLPPPLCVSDTGIYTRLKNCTTKCTPSLFGQFSFSNIYTCSTFTNIYTCSLTNCTTNSTHSVVCCFVWQNIFFVLLTKIYTCLTYLQVSAICDLVILFAKA